MKEFKMHVFSKVLAIVVLTVVAGLLPTLQAQSGTQGLNTIYGTTTSIQGSASSIDARLYVGSQDLCFALNTIINSISVSGAVIDARGVSGTALNCASTPWSTVPSGTFSNAIILLPAGTITIRSPWLMPSNTRIVGSGQGITTIQACKTTTTGCGGVGFSGTPTAMIAMTAGNDYAVGGNDAWGCQASFVCFAVSVADLTLDAQSQAIDGIDNNDAEELSYVQHVSMVNIGGVGLKLSADPNDTSQSCTSNCIAGTSSHSGPYTDLTIAVTSTATACVQVLNTANHSAEPRGIHGLSCTCAVSGTACSTANPNAGIYLDGNNTTLENVFVNGFTDGVSIGDAASAVTPVHTAIVSNITGGTNVTNLIHIHKPSDSGASQAGESGGFTILAATSAANNTIFDELTSTTLLFSKDPYVGMYILADPVGNNSGYPAGYTRFTTSSSLPTWFVGATTVSTGAGTCSSFANGTLYSNTAGALGSTLYACASGGWTVVK